MESKHMKQISGGKDKEKKEMKIRNVQSEMCQSVSLSRWA